MSPPSRAAWIEMLKKKKYQKIKPSPPSRAAWIEIVIIGQAQSRRISRRLHGRRGLKLSVTASFSAGTKSPPSRAAWIEILKRANLCRDRLSPPSRAAWIEIAPGSAAECGDRSPPSRAAWIEMLLSCLCLHRVRVAAFTGGVD